MLDDAIRRLATDKNFATVSMQLPGGAIASHVMWVDTDGEHVLLNTEVHRAKYRALQLDPRVTVTIIDHKNPYAYGEVRGRLVGEIRGERARRHIDELAERYTGMPYTAHVVTERVILQIAPERQRSVGLD